VRLARAATAMPERPRQALPAAEAATAVGGLIGTSCSRARSRQILPTGTKATRGHFLNSFGEAVIIAELDHAAVAAERVAQLTEG